MNTPPGSGDRLFTRNFLLLWATNFTIFTGFQILIPTLPIYVLALGGTESQVGLIIGIFTISAVIFRPFLGREADRRGKKMMLVLGTAALLASMASYNLISTVAILLLLRFFHGAAWAGASVPALGLVADIAPPARRGEAMGYYGMASSVSMAFGPLLGVALVSAYGFPHLFLTATGLTLMAFLITTRVREPRFQPAEGPSLARPALLHRGSFVPASMALFVTISHGGLVSFLPLLAQKNGVNPGIFFSAYAIILVATRPLGGRVADAFGRGAAIIPGMALMAAAMGVLAFSSSLPQFLVVAVLYGAGLSFVHPALLALVVDRASPEARGSAMGTFSAAFDLGMGLGSILLGLLLERSSFQVMYLAASGTVLAGMGVFALGAKKGLKGLRDQQRGTN